MVTFKHIDPYANNRTWRFETIVGCVSYEVMDRVRCTSNPFMHKNPYYELFNVDVIGQTYTRAEQSLTCVDYCWAVFQSIVNEGGRMIWNETETGKIGPSRDYIVLYTNSTPQIVDYDDNADTILYFYDVLETKVNELTKNGNWTELMELVAQLTDGLVYVREGTEYKELTLVKPYLTLNYTAVGM